MRCPPGQIARASYTTKRGSRVASTCIAKKGRFPGKVPESAKVLPKPTAGSLGQYGYKQIKTMSATARHDALTRGVKDAGYATIVRRVNLIANYNKTSDPATHSLMRGDIAWMQRTLAPIYSKTGSKLGSKKPSKKASKKRSKKASKKLSKKASKKLSKRTTKKASKKASKKRSKRTTKKRSKKASKKGSKRS